MTTVHDDLLERRADYPVLSRSTYLASHTLGAMHRCTPERLAAFAGLWAEQGVVAWETWAPEVVRVADVVGSLVGAPPGTTVMRQNLADLLGDVVSALDWRGTRNRVVTSSLEWPGSLHTWSQIDRLGGEAVVVPGEPDGVEVDVQRMVDAIDERTLVVECSHVLFRSSTVVDVKPLIDKAHAVGALAVVDGYQAAGTLPVDVVALDVDIYLGGSVKYLSGGPGNGWMYAAPRVTEQLRPVTTGWFGQSAPFAFDPEISYATGITRFAGGTPGVPAAYAAAPAYEALADIGMQRVRERSQSMTQPLLEAALERGFVVRSPKDPERRGGHVTVDPSQPGFSSQRVHDELHRRGFVVDHRPGVGIRVSPHFYNSLEEARAVLDAMSDVLAGALTAAVPDNGPVTDQATAEASAPPTGKKKRGREAAGDMIRSLGLLMIVVVAIWFFAQPPESDERRGVREIDPSPQSQQWTDAVPGAPLPEGLPQGWRPTAAYYDAAPDRLRIPHVTPSDDYAEFAASTAPAEDFVPEITGAERATETVDVDGEPWDLWVQDDGSRSLVRAFDDGVTVVVGTLRATASLDELTTFAGSVSASR